MSGEDEVYYVTIYYSNHAVDRMELRGITTQEVEDVITNGEVVSYKPNELPLPKRYFQKWCGTKHIKVVCGEETLSQTARVITVFDLNVDD